MDGIMKGGGGNRGGGGGEGDMGDGMQCSEHPYGHNPGGICAFCLQEKLGKLVSSSFSSFPLHIRASSSSSPSPSLRSDIGNGAGSVASLSVAMRPTSTSRNNGGKISHCQEDHAKRAGMIPFILAEKKKVVVASSSSSENHDIIFKRSKSITAPPRRRTHHHFSDSNYTDDGGGGGGCEDFISPTRKGGRFWSYFYHSSSSSKPATATKKPDKMLSTNGPMMKPKDKCLGSSLSRKSDVIVALEDDESPNCQAFERKVSRSRSVGCGSRSFSGDFFERISTGFGDCTLRRVESQREGKPKGDRVEGSMKERAKCGGIFGGFMITSSSSSSSSSSYRVSSSAEDQHMNGKSAHGAAAAGVTVARPLCHGRSRSWGWAFSRPMRAFTRPPSKDVKRDLTRQVSDKNSTCNLSAIPSLLSVRS